MPQTCVTADFRKPDVERAFSLSVSPPPARLAAPSCPRSNARISPTPSVYARELLLTLVDRNTQQWQSQVHG